MYPEPNIVLKAGNITYGEYRTIEFTIISYMYWTSAYVALYPQFSIFNKKIEDIAKEIEISNNIKADYKDNDGRIEEWMQDYVDSCGQKETWLGWAYIEYSIDDDGKQHAKPIMAKREEIIEDIKKVIDQILAKDNL